MKKTGTKVPKRQFLLYNILLDIIVFVFWIALFWGFPLPELPFFIADNLIWVFILFFPLHAVFILAQLFWLKKLSIVKSIIYAIILFVLPYITFKLLFFMVYIGLMLEGSGKGFPY